jgi:DNA primase
LEEVKVVSRAGQRSTSTHSTASGPDYKSQVLAATDIVQLIGQSVGLKRRGKGYIGLCPFHQEKSPSFNVSPARQFFHCFGCKASGNAIDFVMKRDRIDFIDALRALGQQAGIEMPRFGGGSKEKTGERQAMIDSHVATVTFFENFLADPETGAAARAYLQERGFTDEIIKRFHIGLAVDAWDALVRSPVARKFPPPLLAAAGLLKSRDNGNGFYDTFRNRLMFPIRDETGRTIAFGGRVMPGGTDPAKYLNSPETPLFNKSRCVFGLDMAKQKILETRTVAVVEGYADVVMAHQFGVTNVVSILGTGMTEQHVRLLRRFLPDDGGRIVLLFDADAAGSNAAERTVELFLTQPVEMAIASLPDGMDPDEFLIAHGADAFNQILAQATDVLTHKWKQLVRQFSTSPNDLTGQQRAVQHYLELLANARGTGPVDPIRWGSVLARVSRLTEIPIDELNRQFKQTRPRRQFAPAPAPQHTSFTHEDHGDEPTSTIPDAAAPNGSLTNPGAPTSAARDMAERHILGLLLVEPNRWHKLQVNLHAEDFVSARHRRIAEVYWAYQRDEGEPVFNQFLDHLGDPALTQLCVELVTDIEGLIANLESSEDQSSILDQTLVQALGYLAEAKHDQGQQKLLATLRRTSEENTPEQDQLSLFQAIVKNNQATNLHRLGPVKRTR